MLEDDSMDLSMAEMERVRCRCYLTRLAAHPSRTSCIFGPCVAFSYASIFQRAARTRQP